MVLDRLGIPPKESIRRTAIDALLSVAKNAKAAPAARAAAARTLLETLGDIGRLQEITRKAEKPLGEMTKQEMNEEIARLREVLKEEEE